MKSASAMATTIAAFDPVIDYEENLLPLLIFQPGCKEYNEAYEAIKRLESDKGFLAFLTKTLKTIKKDDKFQLTSNKGEAGKNRKLTYFSTDKASLHQVIPNLFLLEKTDLNYQHLLEYLINLVDNKRISPITLDYLKNVTEDDSNTKKYPEHIILDYLFLLISYFYGIEGKNYPIDKKNSEDFGISLSPNFPSVSASLTPKIPHGTHLQIVDILCSDGKIETNHVAFQLIPLFKKLKSFIRHPTNRNLRIQARTICEILKLPLDLAQMLTFNVDGLNQSDKDIEDSIYLVIGMKGAGKSTLINYLNGTNYIRKRDAKIRKDYLEESQVGKDHKNARVGHGISSHTLYPEIINNFCDCPGFGDNRSENHAICTSLAVPLAINSVNHVRAIIVVIEYDSFIVNRGQTFSSINQELSRILVKPHNLEKIKQNRGISPLIIAITKTPYPDIELEEFFDAKFFKDAVKDQISEFYKEKASQIPVSMMTHEFSRKRLEAECFDLELAIRELNEFSQLLKEYDLKKKIEIHTRSVVKSIAISVFIGTGDYDKAKLEAEIQQQITNWKNNDITQNCIDRHLQPFLRKLIFKNLPERETAIKEQTSIWRKEKDKLIKDIHDIIRTQKITEGEKETLDLMSKCDDNIFIIRGFEGKKNDSPDNRKELLEYIARLKQSKCEIPKDEFIFDKDASQYHGVKSWAESFATLVSPLLRALLNIPVELETYEERIRDTEQTQISQKKLLMKSTQKSEKETSDDYINQAIKDLQKQKDFCTLRKDKIKKEIDAIKEKKAAIESIKKVEYGSRKIIDKRTELGRFIGWSTSWDFVFPFEQYKTGASLFYRWTHEPDYPLPIEEVECSSLTQDGKIIFTKEPNNVEKGDDLLLDTIHLDITKITSNKIRNNIAVLQIPPASTHNLIEKKTLMEETGTFAIKEENLAKGILKIQYNSKSGVSAFAGVRTFVQSQRLLRNIETIKDYKREIKKGDLVMANFKAKEEEYDSRIKEKQNHLELVKSRLDEPKKQENMVTHILKTMDYLDFTESEFVDFCFPNSKDIINWFVEENNFKKLVQLLMEASNEQFLSLNINVDKETFKIFLGYYINEKNQKSKSILNETFKYLINLVGKENVTKMYSLSKNSGLSIYSIRDIITKTQKTIKANSRKHTLKEDFREAIKEKTAHQVVLDKLKEIYKIYYLRLKALDKIIKLFKMNEPRNQVIDMGINKCIDQFRMIENNHRARPTITISSAEMTLIKDTDIKEVYVRYNLTKILAGSINEMDISKDTYAEGNSRFNAVALGLFTLIKQNKLNLECYELLAKKLPLTTKDFAGAKSWFKNKHIIQYQREMGEAIRCIAIETIEDSYDNIYREIYETELQSSFVNFLNRKFYEGADDDFIDSFTIHAEVSGKFNELINNDQFLKKKGDPKSLNEEIKQAKIKLTLWWDTHGKKIYFENLKRPANNSPDQQFWGGALEIGALADKFKINILDDGNIYGINFGLIKLSRKEARPLVMLKIISDYKDQYRIEKSVEALDKMIKLQDELSKLSEATHHKIITLITEVQTNQPVGTSINNGKTSKETDAPEKIKYHAAIAEMKDKNLYTLLEELGIINTQLNCFIELEEAKILLSPISTSVFEKIKENIKVLPSFTMKFVNRHWKYIHDGSSKKADKEFNDTAKLGTSFLPSFSYATTAVTAATTATAVMIGEGSTYYVTGRNDNKEDDDFERFSLNH